MGLRTEVQALLQNAGTGLKVNRAAALDAVGPTTIFTITNGFVLVTGLVGVVTVLRAGALATTLFTHSIGPTNLCVATNTIASPVGTVLGLTGNVLDNLVVSVGTGVLNTAPPLQGTMMGSANPGAPTQQFGLIMGLGTIRVTISVVTAGQTRYILTYIPLDAGAVVT